jgi:energy-coupling factor transporter ATP-binding protein EcfA2
MIINLRGTSGSGKTTILRQITALYPHKVSFREAGRKQPIGYLFSRKEGKPLAVVGHYETPCGGCDTIHSMDKIFELVEQAKQNYRADVLFEGLLVSEDFQRSVALINNGHNPLFINLSVPIDVCLASVNARRRQKKPDAPDVNPLNTTVRCKRIESALNRLEKQGGKVLHLSREEAFETIKKELQL